MPKVYVIDDDAAMRDSLSFLLDAANFEVALFESATNFLEMLPHLDFGCVISDVRMPGIDGIELLKRMKSLDSRFPIVIITGHGDVPLAVEAMKLGAVDFLEKPFEVESTASVPANFRSWKGLSPDSRTR
jgi:two-component system, LuxR family, response regulator FixJ